MNDTARIAQLITLLARLASGDLAARGVRSEREDEIDAIVEGVNMLAEELEASRDELVASQSELEASRDELVASHSELEQRASSGRRRSSRSTMTFSGSLSSGICSLRLRPPMRRSRWLSTA